MILIRPDGQIDVALIHPCGETRILPVESIQRSYITIRWGMSGHYDIDLRTNVMRAHSVKARRRNPCLWRASDIESVRSYVREQFRDITEEERTESYTKHAANMPFRKF